MDLLAPLACRSLRTFAPLLPSVRAHLSPRFSSSLSFSTRLYAARPLSDTARCTTWHTCQAQLRPRSLHPLGGASLKPLGASPWWRGTTGFTPWNFNLGGIRGAKQKVARKSPRQKGSPAPKKTTEKEKEKPRPKPAPVTTPTRPSLEEAPLLLFEGPATQSPTTTYLSFAALGTGALMAAQTVLTVLPMMQSDGPLAWLGAWEVRWPLAGAVFAAFFGMAVIQKWLSSANIVRLALYQERGQTRVRVTTATRPFVPRSLGRKLNLALTELVNPKRANRNRRFTMRGEPFSREFTVPLEDVKRASGSALQAGLVDTVSGGRDLAPVDLKISGTIFSLCASGGSKPTRTRARRAVAGSSSSSGGGGGEGSSSSGAPEEATDDSKRVKAFAISQGIHPGTEAYSDLQRFAEGLGEKRRGQPFFIAWITWWLIRGRPQPPYFWSREAFDDLFPESR